MNTTDHYNLRRFLLAQNVGRTYDIALSELRAGKKRSHWIWYVMPRLIGVGYSSMSTYYAIGNRWEARAYLRHPILGARLLACVQAVLKCNGTLLSIFGDIDAPKVRQCAELFASVSDDPIWLHLLCKP